VPSECYQDILEKEFLPLLQGIDVKLKKTFFKLHTVFRITGFLDYVYHLVCVSSLT
jgi:hypothetical protein